MSSVDIIIIILISLIMISIIFFSLIYPKFIKKNKSKCSSCPAGKEKKIKRAFRDYHKKNK